MIRSGETVDERAGVQSVETGLCVLSAFIGAESMPMLKTLAERANMHPAKVHRYLVSLCRSGFVRQDAATGRYRLAEGALRLGFAAMNAVDVVNIARPILQGLRAAHGQSAMLALWGAQGPTVTLQEFHPAPITMSARVGSILPILGRSPAARLVRGCRALRPRSTSVANWPVCANQIARRRHVRWTRLNHCLPKFVVAGSIVWPGCSIRRCMH